MFQELMPLLAQRALLLTISRINVDEISVGVIPQRLKPSETDENSALTTPLSISGTPKELDEELPKQLVEFVGGHLVRSRISPSTRWQGRAGSRTRCSESLPRNVKTSFGWQLLEVAVRKYL